MWHDWRYILLFSIPIFVNIVYLAKRNPNLNWRSEGKFQDFNFREAFVVLVLFFIISWGLWILGRNARINNFDEQIGGFITSKYYEDGSHEVPHETCTGSGNDRSCTTWYETVYHRYFYVLNSTGDWWNGSTWSERVNKPCSVCEPYSIPYYYSIAYIGKPVSLPHSYPNYISAMNEKVYLNTYNGLSSYLKDICPTDFYERTSFDTSKKSFAIGFSENDSIVSEIDSWNFSPVRTGVENYTKEDRVIADIPLYMDTMFGYLGDEVQGDTYVYVVNSTSVEYGQLCMAKWKNGAKNGIYVFIFGLHEDGIYSPTDVYVAMGVDGTTKNSELKFMNESERSNYYVKYDIRNELLNHFNTSSNGINDVATLDREKVLGIIFSNVHNKFVRQEMSNFKNLIVYVYPTDGYMIFMFFCMLFLQGLAISILSNNGE